jgi:hypothetical protein
MSLPFDPGSDLAQLLRPVASDVAERILAAWSWLITKRCSLIGVSAFGDCFLLNEEGHVQMLDLVAGEVRQLAYCVEEFEYDLGSVDAQNEWLMAPLAKRLRASGVEAAIDQCYAFKTPPLLGGKLVPENVVVWDLSRYHSGVSQIIRQVRDLPPGTEVVIRPV